MHDTKYSRAETALGRAFSMESKYAVLRWMVWLNPRENSEFTEYSFVPKPNYLYRDHKKLVVLNNYLLGRSFKLFGLFLHL